MTDWSFVSAVFEMAVLASTVPFYYLVWAAGYVGDLKDSARKNRWGLHLIWPDKYPRHNADGTEARFI